METKKEFDAVKAMRDIREEINREIQDMSFEEQREYMQRQLKAQSGKEVYRAGMTKR